MFKSYKDENKFIITIDGFLNRSLNKFFHIKNNEEEDNDDDELEL